MKLLKLVPDHTNLDFMRWRNLALILSLMATVFSIGLTVYHGLNLGIDFIGGQVVRGEFAKPVHIDELRARVDRLGVGDASIQALGNQQTYQVRLPKPKGPESASNAARCTSRSGAWRKRATSCPGSNRRRLMRAGCRAAYIGRQRSAAASSTPGPTWPGNSYRSSGGEAGEPASLVGPARVLAIDDGSID